MRVGAIAVTSPLCFHTFHIVCVMHFDDNSFNFFLFHFWPFFFTCLHVAFGGVSVDVMCVRVCVCVNTLESKVYARQKCSVEAEASRFP